LSEMIGDSQRRGNHGFISASNNTSIIQAVSF
jgi:hypothetical protein